MTTIQTGLDACRVRRPQPNSINIELLLYDATAAAAVADATAAAPAADVTAAASIAAAGAAAAPAAAASLLFLLLLLLYLLRLTFRSWHVKNLCASQELDSHQ